MKIDISLLINFLIFDILYGLRILKQKENISKLIIELRKITGLSQEKFAAKLGVTFPTINRWENGRTKPSPLAMKQIEEMIRNLGAKDLHAKYLNEEN